MNMSTHETAANLLKEIYYYKKQKEYCDTILQLLKPELNNDEGHKKYCTMQYYNSPALQIPFERAIDILTSFSLVLEKQIYDKVLLFNAL